MKKLLFEITINASREKVWHALWDDKNYRDWTSEFGEGSYVVTDWKEGSRILFLNHNGEGMFSKIEQMIPEEFMMFRHLGIMKDGQEQAPTEESVKWSGITESYRLSDAGNCTRLSVEMDSIADMEQYLTETFPKSLQKVKELAEREEDPV